MKYRTIVADPPWQYRKAPTEERDYPRRFAEDVYPTMTMAEVAALPVAGMAADSAHLYLWTTLPRLNGDRNVSASLTPFDVVRAWGFEYRTMLVWHKLGAPGMGSYFRIDTEVVLFGIRGSAPIEPSIRPSNLFAASKGSHSEKPDRFYEIVERVSPEPRLEMFARRRRVGWDVWGNEAPPESEARTQTHMGLTA